MLPTVPKACIYFVRGFARHEKRFTRGNTRFSLFGSPSELIRRLALPIRGLYKAAFVGASEVGKLLFQAIEFRRDTSWSVGAHYRLWFTAQGNLQLWNVANNGVVWESGTRGERLAMQADGNLTIYDANGRCIWASDTIGNPGAYLAAQDDGNLVIYSADQRRPLWETRTAGK